MTISYAYPCAYTSPAVGQEAGVDPFVGLVPLGSSPPTAEPLFTLQDLVVPDEDEK